MVTITNGVQTFRVTSGAIGPYKSMGFHVLSDEDYEDAAYIEQKQHGDENIISSKENKSKISTGSGDIERNKEDVYIEELLEKPLTQWTNDEVKDFVKIKNIDTSGAQKVSQVRGIIKTYLEEYQKNM